ncbi:hypothetical protein AWU82_17175 [Pseudomonas glycinae]|uniref:Uncharacterized protein n=1 Tax=Pseudomonas glycinae TaxID=1785145 RepID=A0ABM5ZMR3_9PSED|nr:hypothetical protein AWU82_17175 [Pseudomonas glycinae]
MTERGLFQKVSRQLRVFFEQADERFYPLFPFSNECCTMEPKHISRLTNQMPISPVEIGHGFQ